MATDRFGNEIPLNNTSSHEDIVIDAAVPIWMQMGLTTDQIAYGIAMIAVESGFHPQRSNGIKKSSIRGLGQFDSGTWHDRAGQFNREYHLNPADTGYIVTNNNPINRAFKPTTAKDVLINSIPGADSFSANTGAPRRARVSAGFERLASSS